MEDGSLFADDVELVLGECQNAVERFGSPTRFRLPRKSAIGSFQDDAVLSNCPAFPLGNEGDSVQIIASLRFVESPIRTAVDGALDDAAMSHRPAEGREFHVDMHQVLACRRALRCPRRTAIFVMDNLPIASDCPAFGELAEVNGVHSETARRISLHKRWSLRGITRCPRLPIGGIKHGPIALHCPSPLRFKTRKVDTDEALTRLTPQRFPILAAVLRFQKHAVITSDPTVLFIVEEDILEVIHLDFTELAFPSLPAICGVVNLPRAADCPRVFCVQEIDAGNVLSTASAPWRLRRRDLPSSILRRRSLQALIGLRVIRGKFTFWCEASGTLRLGTELVLNCIGRVFVILQRGAFWFLVGSIARDRPSRYVIGGVFGLSHRERLAGDRDRNCLPTFTLVIGDESGAARAERPRVCV